MTALTNATLDVGEEQGELLPAAPTTQSSLRVTNAGTEATNRTIKTVARTTYGFRNLDNQRRRVRFACTRCHRISTAA